MTHIPVRATLVQSTKKTGKLLCREEWVLEVVGRGGSSNDGEGKRGGGHSLSLDRLFSHLLAY